LTAASRGALLVALAAGAWGSWSVFLRPVGLPPVVCSTLVFVMVALFSVPFFRLDPAPRWDRRTLALLAAFSALDAVNVGTFFAAMDTTSVAVAVLTHSLAPLVVALAAPYVDGQRNPVAPKGALLALAGIVLVLRPWASGGQTGDAVLGAALGSTSALAYAGNIFLARRLTPRLGAFRTMGLHAAGSALLLTPLALGQATSVAGSDLAWLAGGAALLGVGGNVAFARGLVVIGSARAAVLAFLEPVVACAIGWALWGEPLGGLAVTGAGMVLGAGLLVTRAQDAPNGPG
jgi:drug/metabolite transporter (DMT)-like permease